jgi:mannose-6-phosphate isomerase
MGTHVSSPSIVAKSGDLLSNYLKQNKKDIGERVVDRFSASDGVLPFLFKVLSIDKALSIQTHPDKATAEKLHAEQPHIYKGAHERIVLVSLAHVEWRRQP